MGVTSGQNPSVLEVQYLLLALLKLFASQFQSLLWFAKGH